MRHFFALCWKARTRREGHTWQKGDRPPPAPEAGTFTHARLGRPQRRDGKAWSSGVLRGEGSARGARIAAERGDGPPPAAGPEPGKGGRGRLPRVPRARPRGGRQGAQQAPGRAGPRSVASHPPSGRGNVGARTGGPPGWVAPAGPRRPAARPESSSRSSGLHHVGGCWERPKRVHRCGPRGPPEARGRVRGAPERRGRGLRPGWVSWVGSGPRNAPRARTIGSHCGNPPAPASGLPGHLPLASSAM